MGEREREGLRRHELWGETPLRCEGTLGEGASFPRWFVDFTPAIPHAGVSLTERAPFPLESYTLGASLRPKVMQGVQKVYTGVHTCMGVKRTKTPAGGPCPGLVAPG